MNPTRFAATSTFAVLLLSGCAATAPQVGDPSAKTAATGSVGGANAQRANSALERCDKPLGTIALVEDANQPWLQTLSQQYRMQSTVPMLRMIIQQSGCFVVVERGRAMNNIQTQRALNDSGELRKGSKVSRGKLVAADYTCTPSVSFSQEGTGGLGGLIGARAGSVGAVIGSSLRSNEASTMLLLTDNRSGIQLAAAEGSAKNWDFGAVGSIFGGSGAGAGAYSQTPQGKVLMASFLDSYNGLVRATRSYKAQDVAGGLGKGGQLKTN